MIGTDTTEEEISLAMEHFRTVLAEGKASRELFEIRDGDGQPHKYDFLTVGSMGLEEGFGASHVYGCGEQEGFYGIFVSLARLLYRSAMGMSQDIRIMYHHGS